MADTQTLRGLDDVLAKLKSLPPEIVSRRGGPVKSALRKGGNVVRDEWRSQVQRIVDTPNADDLPSKSIGLLKKSIIATRHPRPHEFQANEAYTVRIKGKQFYPPVRGERVSAGQVGKLLEIGTERRAAMPWATPGYMASRQRALDTVVTELSKGVQRVIRKLERGR